MPAICLPPVRAVPTASDIGCLPVVPGRGPSLPRSSAAAETAGPATPSACLNVSLSNLTDMVAAGYTRPSQDCGRTRPGRNRYGQLSLVEARNCADAESGGGWSLDDKVGTELIVYMHVSASPLALAGATGAFLALDDLSIRETWFTYE